MCRAFITVRIALFSSSTWKVRMRGFLIPIRLRFLWTRGNKETSRASLHPAGCPSRLTTPMLLQPMRMVPSHALLSRGIKFTTSRFDPVAASLLKFFPEPNASSSNPYTPVNNWTQLGKDSADQLNFGVRVDHNFTDKWRALFGRFTQSTQMISPNDFFGQAGSSRAWSVPLRGGTRSYGITPKCLGIPPPCLTSDMGYLASP